MDDFNQIEVPPSFLALFTAPAGHRLIQPMGTIRDRYELCEDMALMLTDQAGTALFKSGGSTHEVLAKMKLALLGADSVLQADEADWVVTRIAELLGWEFPKQI